MDTEDVLNAIAFIFTITMVLYGLNKGFDNIELITNLMYFSVLLILHIKILHRALKR